MGEFAWYWISMAVAVVLLTAILRFRKMWPWHLGFDEDVLIIATPWWALQLMHEGYDTIDDRRRTGIRVTRRIPSTWHMTRATGEQVYKDVLSHELRTLPYYRGF
jgi:hypothetical protein